MLPLEQGDKLSHTLGYLVLMSWFANIYATPSRRVRSAIGFIPLGVALEFLQRWTGYRTFEVTGECGRRRPGIDACSSRTPNYLVGLKFPVQQFHEDLLTHDLTQYCSFRLKSLLGSVAAVQSRRAKHFWLTVHVDANEYRAIVRDMR